VGRSTLFSTYLPFAPLLVCIIGCGNPAMPSNPSVTASLIGIVTDPRGAPVPNASVQITTPGQGLRVTAGSRTDTNGRYQIDNLPTRHTDVQVVTSGQYLDAPASINLIAPGPNILNFQLQAPPLFALRGTVTDADTGLPIAGATVFIAATINGPAANAGLSATTSADGNYAIPNVSAGNANVWAIADGYQVRALALEANQRGPLNFQLKRIK
jgi:hypothetical protein